MKITNILFLFVLTAFSMPGQAAGEELKSEIDRVTVFYQGAQIERSTSTLTLPAGQSDLVIKGLEQSLQDGSLRVGIIGQGKILTVVRTTDYLNMKSSNEQIVVLRDKLESLEDRVADENVRQRVYEQERNLLLSNSKLGGTQSGVSVAQIKEAAAYYRMRLTEIEQLILEVNRTVEELNEEIGKIKRQLSELNYRKNQPTSTLNISVEMDRSGPCSLMFDYFIPNASWYPQYDIRIDEIGKPVNLVRKASVRQSSGEDWSGVVMTFSTGNPNERQVLPELSPWYLDFIQPLYNQLQGKAKGVAAKRAPQAVQSQEVMLEEVVMVDDEADYSAPTVTRSTSQNSILEFTLSTAVSIPSDNNEYSFSLGSEDLDASYHYQSVPKLDKAAYLVATINDWEGYELVDGVANIYYEKTYIGETFLGTNMLLDSLQMSLGRGKGVIVERKSIKDYTRSRSIGSNVKKSFAYEIQVRNTKPVEVDLILQDQVPVSSNSQITVEAEETGDGLYDEATGKVTWRIRVRPNETTKIPLKYSVKYPKGMSPGI